MCRALIAGPAMLLEFHLFFVVELHHHPGDAVLGPDAGQVSTARLAQWQPSTGADPICAACRISHRGAVQIAAASSVPFQATPTESLPPSSRLRVCSASLLLSSGRAPPLS